MEKKEKVEFILEQMRLCIAVKDYIRTQIISKKINTKFFQEEGTEVRGGSQELRVNKILQCVVGLTMKNICRLACVFTLEAVASFLVDLN